jgi:hypothetical protein
METNNATTNTHSATAAVLPFHFNGNNNLGLQFLEQEMPRRFAFTIKAFVAFFGQNTLYDGANFVDYFNGVFAENATLSVDPLPAISMTRGFVDDSNQLLPWWNDFLEVAIIREFHGTTGYVEIWQVLGRSLTRKLDFFSTIVRWHSLVSRRFGALVR